MANTNQRSPFRRIVPTPIVEIESEPSEQEDSQPEAVIPLTPFQRHVLDGLDRLDRGQRSLFQGQTDLTVAFGKLAPRVQQLEDAAKWKAWAKTVGKAAVPFLGGLVVHYVPALAKHLPAILDALGSVP